MNFNTGDDVWVVKYKQAGMSSADIAKKLGKTAAEIDKRWEEILIESKRQQESGHADLQNQFSVLCQQYQLLGQSLKLIAGGLSDIASPLELSSFLEGPNPLVNAEELCRRFIILRPFSYKDPIAVLEEEEKRRQVSN